LRFQTKKASARATALFVASALMVGIVSSSAGATTGKITVTTPGGTATSATNFAVATVTKHRRSVTLNLSLRANTLGGGNSLIASGWVKVPDGLNACRSYVTVKIQWWKKKTGFWKTVETRLTSREGKYKKVVANFDPVNPGKYRASAPRQVRHSGGDICLADRSGPVVAPLG